MRKCLLSLTVQQNTLAGYESQLSPLRRFAEGLGMVFHPTQTCAHVVTQEVFDLFLLSSVRSGTPVPPQLRIALRKQQECAGLEMWAGMFACACV